MHGRCCRKEQRERRGRIVTVLSHWIPHKLLMPAAVAVMVIEMSTPAKMSSTSPAKVTFDMLVLMMT